MRKPVSARRQKKNLIKDVKGSVDLNSTNDVELKFIGSSVIGENLLSDNKSFAQPDGVQEALVDKVESQEISNQEIFKQIQLVKDDVTHQFGQQKKVINKLVVGQNSILKNNSDLPLINNALIEIETRLNKYEILVDKLIDQNKGLIESIGSVGGGGIADEHYNALNQIVIALDSSLSKLLYVENNSEVKKENNLLLNQLNIVQQELEKLILKNRNTGTLTEKKSEVSDKVYFGAVNHIKQQLPYRLGATAIEHSRDLNGLLKLPYALLVETIAVKKGQNQEISSPLLEEYSDAYEAERVKKHLSYQLGVVMVDNSKSLKGLIKMPFEVHRVIKGFQKKAK